MTHNITIWVYSEDTDNWRFLRRVDEDHADDHIAHFKRAYPGALYAASYQRPHWRPGAGRRLH